MQMVVDDKRKLWLVDARLLAPLELDTLWLISILSFSQEKEKSVVSRERRRDDTIFEREINKKCTQIARKSLRMARESWWVALPSGWLGFP